MMCENENSVQRGNAVSGSKKYSSVYNKITTPLTVILYISYCYLFCM